jgi:hypothetical protein
LIRAAWSARWSAWGSCVVVPLAGCAAVTDLGVSGYQLADAGQSGDAACQEDAVCVSLGCVAAANCSAGQVCCLTASSTSSVDLACQPAPCEALAGVQLCKTDAECVNGARCTTQQCAFGGPALTIGACNRLPNCSPLP